MRCTLNLDCGTGTNLRPLDNFEWFVVNLNRGAVDWLSHWVFYICNISTYILPKETISLFPVSLSTFTTPIGVPMRIVPSMMSQPRMIGSR